MAGFDRASWALRLSSCLCVLFDLVASRILSLPQGRSSRKQPQQPQETPAAHRTGQDRTERNGRMGPPQGHGGGMLAGSREGRGREGGAVGTVGASSAEQCPVPSVPSPVAVPRSGRAWMAGGQSLGWWRGAHAQRTHATCNTRTRVGGRHAAATHRCDGGGIKLRLACCSSPLHACPTPPRSPATTPASGALLRAMRSHSNTQKRTDTTEGRTECAVGSAFPACCYSGARLRSRGLPPRGPRPRPHRTAPPPSVG
jgi:hypothetical protein